MTEPTAKPTQRAPEVAVAPLNTIDPQDVGAGAAAFDKWLRKISHDYVTLERLSTVAGSLPVIGNIMALIDAVMDVVGVIQKYIADKQVHFVEWVSLGINLIGVIPLPATAAARMSLRPALHLARQKLAMGFKDVGATLIEVLVLNLNAKLAGELDTFIDGAMARLSGILDDCAKMADGIADDLINILNRCIGKKPLFDIAAPAEVEYKLHDHKVQSSWRRMLGALDRQYKRAANYAAATAASQLPQSAVAGVTAIITHLTNFKPAFRAQLTGLADEKAQMSIKWILMRLRDEVVKHKRPHGALVPSNKGAQHKHDKPGQELEVVNKQHPATGDPDQCKLCPAKAATTHSISFATGAETFTHTDFVLDAPLPIEWSRTYRSQLIAYDRGNLGARWLTPYSTRIDVIGQGKPTGLRYHAADGRSHRYPWLAVGEKHYDPVEQITLTRLSMTLLTLDFGKPLPEGEPSPWRETYELTDTVRAKAAEMGKQHFRLISVHAKDGAALGLRYDHVAAGEEVLSDIISKQGDNIVAHAGTQVDSATGHIVALWEIKDGKLVRQLAAYDYDEHGDLISAQDENAASWQYQYDRHLVTRYTDRTGRGINLAYDTSIDSGANAKAIREWADDGSHDTRLEWDKNIRLTYVTDALGNETRYYYDIAGYTYRTIYPDGGEEWFFRDDAENVVRHIRTDGSSEHYRYDDHGNLLTHSRADGSQVHFEYDAQHRITGILDAEGGIWKRDYDAKGHLVEEIDPRGNKTQYAYDKAGRPVEVTDAKGGVKKLAYTPDGQLASYTDCSGHSSQWEYDDRKRLIKSIDAAGNITRYRYTPISVETLTLAHSEEVGNHPGQLEAVIHPDGTEEQLRHDAEGRLLAHIDAMQRRTAYRYTAAGQIAQRTDALGHNLRYRWDALGRLSTLENENGSVYRFQYDPVGRLLQEQGFDGKTTEYRYAEGTGVLAETVEAGVTTRLEFDAMGRLTQRRAAAPGQPEQIETFAYNANGQLADAKNEHARLQWFYDTAGNLVREHQYYHGPFHPDKRTAVWHHRYDELNQRTGTTRPDGHRIEWLTYGAGHVHGLLLDGQELVSFERDALYQETGRTQANGLMQTMKYDPAGRLVEQQLGAIAQLSRKDREFIPGTSRLDVQVGMQAAIRRRYRYDPSGHLTSLDDTRRGHIEYRYDPVGRLLAANSVLGHETFAFDPAGNIQVPNTAQQHQSIATRAPLPKVLDNLLKEYAGVSYRYDERGNLIERQRNGQRDTFEWDAFSRMARATTLHGVTAFAYDPLGRRIAKHSQAIGSTTVRKTNQTMYSWDGDTLALESSMHHHGYVNEERTVHYVYERDSFVPLVQATRSRALQLAPTTDVKALMARNDGKYDLALDPLWNGEYEQQAEQFGKDEIAFYQCDHLGTPQELTDYEGKVAWSALYKAWGQAKEAISSAACKAGMRSPIRFQGQYEDAETGLFYNRYRYYDPDTARFLTHDPLGLRGGQNLTHTCRIQPLGWIHLGSLQEKGEDQVANPRQASQTLITDVTIVAGNGG